MCAEMYAVMAFLNIWPLLYVFIHKWREAKLREVQFSTLFWIYLHHNPCSEVGSYKGRKPSSVG